MRHSLPVLLALPWLLTPVVTLWRARRSRSLDEEPADAPADAPFVSLVIPARNEAHNIARCVGTALAARYPRFEVIVVDDHSTDGTGRIVAELAGGDPRVRIVTPAPLPPGWFGKQWACAAGAAVATGDVVGFMDADTWQSPDLLPRIVNAMRSRGSAFLTVAGTQEMGTLWERLLQPQVFAILLARYGGTEIVNESPRATDKIANGQCLFVRRDAYDAVGGHASVRDKVGEDLALAQRFFRLGHRTTMVLGLDQFSTRMYTSLRELVADWGKNIYAGGIDTMPMGAFGRMLYPVLMLVPPLTGIFPPCCSPCRSRGCWAAAGWCGRHSSRASTCSGGSACTARSGSRPGTPCCTRWARRCCCTSPCAPSRGGGACSGRGGSTWRGKGGPRRPLSTASLATASGRLQVGEGSNRLRLVTSPRPSRRNSGASG